MLHKKILGTPSGKFWKDLNLEFSPSFVKKKLLPKSWSKVSTKFSHIPYCENLLSLFLKLEPRERITADDALQHCYFATLPKAIHHIPQTTVNSFIKQQHKITQKQADFCSSFHHIYSYTAKVVKHFQSKNCDGSAELLDHDVLSAET
ncbi:Cyclin-dependent kinase 16 [Trichinella pseudospiralis]|uniref:Cyclin-dependent kinase 16 n=1 Tax=Trichinella pseudospiralis TaxID=6337 RepID=A0A0V0YC20_TRIPS|nr:Cyclin-dependent kinase 16 [Trichinella pseudospiralis]